MPEKKRWTTLMTIAVDFVIVILFGFVLTAFSWRLGQMGYEPFTSFWDRQESTSTFEILPVADGSPLLVSLVKPTIPVKPGARSVHGIGDDELADAPGFDDVLPRLEEALRGRVVVVYNLAYDWQILTASAYAHDLDLGEVEPAERVCAMELYAQFWGDWDSYHENYRWQRLSDAAEQQGVSLPEGMALHTARADAELTRQVLIAMATAELPDAVLSESEEANDDS